MTATIHRPPGTRQPYYRRFAGRTAQWTVIVTTAMVAGRYIGEVFGLAGIAGLALGAPVAAATGLLAHAAVVRRQRWAVVLTVLLWAGWLIAGYTRHGWHNAALLAQGLGVVALVVGATLAGLDHRERQR